MISFTQEQSLWGSLSDDASSTSKALGAILCNEKRREILSSRRWRFLEKTKTLSTVASQQAYDLPSDLAWLSNVTVTISSTRYTPKEIKSREEWDILNQSTSVTSDTPEYFFLTNSTIEFYPIPSSSTSNAITFKYGRKQKDLSIADYTTGGILTMVNGSSAVVGTGTTFTESMVGRWLRITESDTANKGDGEWYEIAGYTSATAITLDLLYNGTAITAGNAAYTIGQVSLLPESYQMLPLYAGLVIYFTSIKPDQVKSKLYNDLYVNTFAQMESSESGKSSNPVLNHGIYEKMPVNPNNYPPAVS